MMGKFLVVLMLGCAVIGGGLMYYLQVYAFYEPLPETTVVRVTLPDGSKQPLSIAEFQGIDAYTSPLRMRACLQLADAGELAQAVPAVKPEPLVAPGWFDCFDAAAIGAALTSGAAKAYVSEHEIARGVDRVIAAYPDGRAFVWHQLNGTLEK
jgi:hypothetical protein